MQSLSKSDEQQLLDGVKMAVSLVDDQGLSPNAALQKVAEELHYSPGFLKAACNAFNTGRQLAQWNANGCKTWATTPQPWAITISTMASNTWPICSRKTPALECSIATMTYPKLD